MAGATRLPFVKRPFHQLGSIDTSSHLLEAEMSSDPDDRLAVRHVERTSVELLGDTRIARSRRQRVRVAEMNCTARFTGEDAFDGLVHRHGIDSDRAARERRRIGLVKLLARSERI